MESGNEQKCGESFDDGVEWGNSGMAIAAAASQEHVAQQRDVVEPTNGMFAERAMGARNQYRFLAGESNNAHVQEAAQGESKDCYHYVRQDGRSLQ